MSMIRNMGTFKKMGIPMLPPEVCLFGTPYFIDDDDGSDSQDGLAPNKGFATIQKGIDIAGKHDTIYLKPREIDLDTHSSHGYFTGSNIIPTGMQGLAIIGTAHGSGIGMAAQVMVEPDSGSTDMTFIVRSPGVSFENLGIKAVTSSGGGIYAHVSTAQAYGMTISNCFFKDFQGADVSSGSINLQTTHWVTIEHCLFKECGVAISLGSPIAATRAATIRNCDFIGVNTTWSQPIRLGACTGLIIDKCNFAFNIPTGGTRNFYIDQLGTSGDGIVSNCNFADTEQGVTVLMTLVGTTLQSNCWSDGTAAIT